ncbi:hypothetical protein [Clostridium sp. ZS2-4]|uniref:hypothetical protein n=1 Tax=Clostridium sp. ZS2-4 TaxID=2987703 RepID=UPI00227C4D98|nr:hypothetical protein [Clostridium sp. ZS2-4]MCY6354061.1 hypothetical protein [Clostridium sp. ZS2-4]
MIIILLVLMLILTSLMYIFNIEVIRRGNIYDHIKYELGENVYEKHREYLLSRTKKYILDNLSSVTEESIQDLLCKMSNTKICFDSSYVQYDKEQRNIVLYIYPKGKTYKKEYYGWKIKDDSYNKILFYYIKTQY